MNPNETLDVNHTRRTVIQAIAAAGCALSGGNAFSQAGSPTVRLLCGSPPGSGNDATARLVAEKMRDKIGGSVVVENKPGAGSRIAIGEIRRSAPDGRTLLLTTTGPFTIYPHIYSKLDYDSFRDFTPIASLASFDVAIAVSPELKVSNIQEFLALARTTESLRAFGSQGNGSLSHFVGISLGLVTGIDFTHVAYKDSGLAAIDLAGGRLPILILGIGQLIRHHQEGKIRILAISGSHRSAHLPGIPTLRESGINVSNTTTVGLFGPAGMKEESVRKLEEISMQIVKTDEAKDRLGKFLFEPAPGTGKELAALMREEHHEFARLVKASGYKPE